eukprot:TRINITY_DN5935_c0_g2_i1.p1 TRINITY_DN5935_c0_g2~~TRINITY_DN5935_c0_g2_i1.p1  ORF type:complete len:144 (-),score=44.41 TRINITY_DN5935_c0_g2_i1:556-987(-)
MLEEALAKQRSRHQQEMQGAALKERNLGTALESSRRLVSGLKQEKDTLEEELVVLREKLRNSTSVRELAADAHVDGLKDEIKELKRKAHEAYVQMKALSADRTPPLGRSALPASPPVSASPRSTLDLEGDSKTFFSTGAGTDI